MRDIKFRAWDEQTGRWEYFRLPHHGHHVGMRLAQNRLKHFTEFTGLKDKNGKEIFEGDIMDVKFNTGYVQRISWKGPSDARAVVFWDFAGFRLKCKGPEDARYADWTDTDGYFDPILEMERSESEIIGNIYEHGYLLSDKVSGRIDE